MEQIIPKSQSKNILCIIDIDPGILLYGDENRLAQVFRGLIDNSIKYSNNDSTIHIRAIDNYCGEYNLDQVEGVLIQIEDEGIGIDEKDLKHLFERFFRSDQVKNIPGTGLGLNISQQFVQMHRGKIFVQSEFGKGTTFSVFLPRLEKQPDMETQLGKMKILKCD